MDDQTLLHCPICMDFAENAVETLCCGIVYCDGCLSASGVTCPTCRDPNVKYRPSILARRAIGAMPTQCPFICGQQITKADVQAHVLICDNRQYTCPDKKCQYIGKKEAMGEHILKHHKDELMKNMNLLFDPPLPPPAYPGFAKVDPIITTKNDAGNTCRLGETGKYYCGRAGCNSSNCCDGRCGPTNGCNCAPCQIMDLKTKNVPPGFLVNREGSMARPGATGRFYCGRRVLVGVPNTDGYCGPTNGPQCSSCQALQRQTRPGYLYGALWRDMTMPESFRNLSYAD